MKTSHANLGLINVLFMPGASGTFLANMLARAITDPWWDDYSPELPNEVFEITKEYINQYNHLAMTWHPFDLKHYDSTYDLKNVNWINLVNTKDELEFTDVMANIKRQHFEGITKKDILDRLYATSNVDYNDCHNWQHEAATMLRVNNNVLDINWSDVFVKGDADVILSMINHLFKGQYTTVSVAENIAKKCIAKHKADLHTYNELKYDPDKVIDNILDKLSTIQN
ncbi:hypothetical protein N9E03_01425 [bacterium]|nr:hypothetical protein [bacterium]